MGGALSSDTDIARNTSEIHSSDSTSPDSSDPSASSSSSSNRRMSSSNSKTLESESEISGTLEKESSAQSSNSAPIDGKIGEGGKIEQDSEESNGKEGGGEDEEGEEEEGECGFCLFMKGGGCKESFIAWEQCIEEAENAKEDIVEKCFQATSALKKCMEAHSDYYEPILRAEKSAEEEAVKELEKEIDAASKGSDQIASSKESEDQQAILKEPEQQADSSHR